LLVAVLEQCESEYGGGLSALMLIILEGFAGMVILGFVDVGSGAEGVGGDGSWKSMEMEIESLLEKLLDINDAMSRCVAAAISTTSVTQKLARHRDILHEFTQVFCPSFYLARPLDCFTQYGWMDGWIEEAPALLCCLFPQCLRPDCVLAVVAFPFL
jgi:hypothetical protein